MRDSSNSRDQIFARSLILLSIRVWREKDILRLDQDSLRSVVVLSELSPEALSKIYLHHHTGVANWGVITCPSPRYPVIYAQVSTCMVRWYLNSRSVITQMGNAEYYAVKMSKPQASPNSCYTLLSPFICVLLWLLQATMSSDGCQPCSNIFEGTIPLVHCLGRVESMWLLVSVVPLKLCLSRFELIFNSLRV
jgi:hypothetical protein